jgi:hypothetical protein
VTDTGLVASIVSELREGGPLRERRPPSDDPQTDRTQLADYVASEVQRSIARVRRRRMPPEIEAKLPPAVKAVTIADFRKAARLSRDLAAALRKVALFDDQRSLIPELERISQELGRVQQIPSAHADALKYRCAREAFDLMAFSAKPPTAYEDWPFQTIAALLYGTGEPHHMKRACDLILRYEKKSNRNAFKRS